MAAKEKNGTRKRKMEVNEPDFSGVVTLVTIDFRGFFPVSLNFRGFLFSFGDFYSFLGISVYFSPNFWKILPIFLISTLFVNFLGNFPDIFHENSVFFNFRGFFCFYSLSISFFHLLNHHDHHLFPFQLFKITKPDRKEVTEERERKKEREREKERKRERK